MKHIVVVTSVLFSLAANSLCQDCFRPNNTNGFPAFEDYRNSDFLEQQIIPLHHQAIVPSYRFNCCGSIVQWGVDLDPAGGGDNMEYDLSLQVWRPQAVDAAGCYSMVGSNTFFSIELSGGDQVAVLTPSPSSSQTQDIINFQPGDVIGFNVVRARNPDGRGVVVLLDRSVLGDRGYETEEIWHADTSDVVIVNPMCPFPIGTEPGRVLNTLVRAAPVISVSYSMSSCPPTAVPTQPPQPTPTTDGRVVQPTTRPGGGATDTVPSGGESSSNLGLIVGVVVSVILITIIVTVAIVLLIYIMLRRGGFRSKGNGLVNPSYDLGGRSKKFNRSKLPPIDATNSGVYESLDAQYNDIPLDYTYPTPSPTSKQDPGSETAYACIPDNGNCVPSLNGKIETIVNAAGNINQRNIYHSIGPDVVQHYEFDSNGGAAGSRMIHKPAVPGPNAMGSRSHYQNTDNITADEFGNSNVVVYEDPTLPKFREEMSSAGLFETAGVYVPTEEQRVALGNHYELAGESEQSTYNKLKFFVEDQIYWAPASTTSDLYSQLASKKYREIPRSQIKFSNQLGSGQFGQVCKGAWSVDGVAMELAIKTLKPGAPEGEKVKLLQEAAIMGQFFHPNVVKLYGVVTVGEPVMICLELMTNGDLRSYLQSIDAKATAFDDLQTLFLRFAKEIAAGMRYLSKKSFIHRDLAARNILLDSTATCKIGDFGMARDLMDDTYYKSSGGKIPVKWTAPEALLFKKYSTDSDVWSYGMVLFEIWSVGKKPFSQLTNNQVLKLVQTGHCQPPPPGCPRAIYKLMVDCWNPEHQHRPLFDEICTYLQQPATDLINWNKQDNSIAENVDTLGAQLVAGIRLYMDLQEAYKEQNVYEAAP